MTVEEVFQLENPADIVIAVIQNYGSFTNHEKADADLSVDEIIFYLNESHHDQLDTFRFFLNDTTVDKEARRTAHFAIGQICGYRSAEYKEGSALLYPTLARFTRAWTKFCDRIASGLSSLLKSPVDKAD